MNYDDETLETKIKLIQKIVCCVKLCLFLRKILILDEERKKRQKIFIK